MKDLKALASNANDIPFYVAIPEGTLDLACENGVRDIEIETRSSDELKYVKGITKSGEIEEVLIMSKDAKAVNYGFDITPNELVSAFVMAKGIIKTTDLKKIFL